MCTYLAAMALGFTFGAIFTAIGFLIDVKGGRRK